MTISVEIKHGGGNWAVRVQDGNGVRLATLAPGETTLQHVWVGSRPLVIVEGDRLPDVAPPDAGDGVAEE